MNSPDRHVPRYSKTTTTLRRGGFSRRDLLKIGLGVAAGLATAAELRYGFLEKLGELADMGETEDQKKAAEILKSDHKRALAGLRIRRIEQDGEVISAKIRNKPRIEVPLGGEPDTSAGDVVGSLREGTELGIAIAVSGNDPDFPLERDKEAIWLAFFDPENKGRVVFTYAGNVEPTLDPYKIEPYDLR